MRSVVHVTPSSSAEGLFEILEIEAARRGQGMRAFVGEIIYQALENKELFDELIKNPARRGGKAISGVIGRSEKNALTKWAKSKNTSRGKWICFILEKTIETNSLPKN